jgi:branched-chain amino acid transport system substrate-binding protein
MNRKVVLAAGLVLVLVGASLAAWRSGLIFKRPLVIALLVPLSGPDAADGAGLRNAAQMAIDEANARGGAQGHALQLDVRDEPRDLEAGFKLAKELAADPRVLAVLGPASPDAYNALHGPLRDLGMPVVLAAVRTRQKVDLFGTSTNTEFSLLPMGPNINQPCARYAWETLGARRYLHVREFGLAGDLNLAFFRSALVSLSGGKQVLEELVRQGATDFSELVEKVRAQGVEHVYYSGGPVEGGRLLKQLRAAGVGVAFQLASSAAPQSFLDEAGPAAEGAVTCFPGLPDELTPAGKAFLERYRARGFKEPPGRNALFTYVGAQSVVGGLEKSFLIRPSLAGALKSETVDTVLGKLKYFPGGSSYQTLAVYKVVSGRWTPILVAAADGKLAPFAPAP